MTKKPKATEAQAAELEPAEAVAADPDAVAAEVEPVPDGIDDGGIEAEEAPDEPAAELEPEVPQTVPESTAVEQEGNQPDPQQAQDDQAGDATEGNRPEADHGQDPVAEPTAEQLQLLADRIRDMLAWHRDTLVLELVNDLGMTIDRSIEGVRVSMLGLEGASPIIGPTGEHHALENWAMAARRQILELQAVPHV